MTPEEIVRAAKVLFPNMDVSTVWVKPAICVDCPEYPGECIACRKDPAMRSHFNGDFGIELRIIPKEYA